MHIAFALPETTETGGGMAVMRGLVSAVRALGHRVDVLEGDAPAFPPGAVPVVDGMVLPALRDRLGALVAADAVAVVHHVSARAGRDDGARESVAAVERAMLPALRRVVATSAPVVDRLTGQFGVAHPHLIGPGIAELPRSVAVGETCRILSVGVLTPRKGHDRLLRALGRLTDLDWHLTIAGDGARDPVHAAGLPGLAEELGLTARVTLLRDPGPDALEAAWQEAGLFALATRWEGYASAVAEAVRRGIPAVVTTGGEAGALITPECGAACAPDDPATFGKCLRRMVFDRGLRADMADAAWQIGQGLPGWPEQARAFISVLEG